MGILQQCCFCCDVRRGAMYSGIYCLTSSLVFVSMMIVRFVGYKLLQKDGALPGVGIAILGIFSVEITCTVLLVIGIHKDARYLITPWIITTIISMILPTCGLIWIIVTSLWETGEIHGWDLALSSYHFCNSIILIYCVLCVISQLQDLFKGKGTAEAYRRRRERRRMMQAFAEMHLPLDVELDLFQGGLGSPLNHPDPVLNPPPYSAKPPSYRENSDDQSSRERSAAINRGRPGNVSNRAEPENGSNTGNNEASEETVRTNREVNVSPVETRGTTNDTTGVNHRSPKRQTSRLKGNQNNRNLDSLNGRNTTAQDVPGPSHSQQQHIRDHEQHPLSDETEGHSVHRRERHGHGSRHIRGKGMDHGQSRPPVSNEERHHHGGIAGNHQNPRWNGHRVQQRYVARQQQRSGTNPSPVLQNGNANKHKGKSRRSNKRSNEVLLRSYEQSNCFDEEMRGMHFEQPSRNREGV